MFNKLLVLLGLKAPEIKKRGNITARYKAKLRRLKPGETVFISADSIDIDILRNSISSYAVKNWGCGGGSTSIIRSKNKVKVVRIL